MNIKQVQRILMTNFLFMLLVAFLLVVLYETEIPDQLEECMVPRMLLQPLVENAIIHGLDGCENGYICIFADQKDGVLSISITDDSIVNLSRNINMADTRNATAVARTDVLTGMLTIRKFAQVACCQHIP